MNNMQLALIGDVGKRGDKKYRWLACPICGRERWVRLDKGKANNTRCFACQPMGKDSHNWRGGKQKDAKGYIRIKLPSDSLFYAMTNRRSYIMEHRLVMAEHLGRCLTGKECVHHINGKKEDNRIENLKLTTRETHRLDYQSAYNEGMIAGLKLRDKSLEKQIKLLQWQIKELKESLVEATKWRYQ